MLFHRLLIVAACLLAASCVLAGPLHYQQTEGSSIRGLFGRDVLPLNDAVAQFKTSIGAIRMDLDTIGGANVSSINTAKKATDDLKASYDNFHANLEALKAAKKAQAVERGFPFGECGVVKDVGGMIKDVLVLVDIIKSAIAGDPMGASEIITAIFATLSIIVQGVPTLLTLALSFCSPF